MIRLAILIVGILSLPSFGEVVLKHDRESQDAVRLAAQSFSQAYHEEIEAVVRKVALERTGRSRATAALVIACTDGGCRE